MTLSLVNYLFMCRVGQLTINVLGLVPADLADLELTIGSLSSTVATGEIVDHETQDVLAGDVGGKLSLQLLNVGNGVKPEERADIADLGGGGGQALVAQVLDSLRDLGLVE